jgi:hypothetical protein
MAATREPAEHRGKMVLREDMNDSRFQCFLSGLPPGMAGGILERMDTLQPHWVYYEAIRESVGGLHCPTKRRASRI